MARCLIVSGLVRRIICELFKADAGERLLADQRIICRLEILSSMRVIHPLHMDPLWVS